MAVPREETYEYNGADIYIGTDGEGEFYANGPKPNGAEPCGARHDDCFWKWRR